MPDVSDIPYTSEVVVSLLLTPSAVGTAALARATSPQQLPAMERVRSSHRHQSGMLSRSQGQVTIASFCLADSACLLEDLWYLQPEGFQGENKKAHSREWRRLQNHKPAACCGS